MPTNLVAAIAARTDPEREKSQISMYSSRQESHIPASRAAERVSLYFSIQSGNRFVRYF